MKQVMRLMSLVVATAAVAGCAGDGPSWGGVKHDLTPEMGGLATTGGDLDRDVHVAENQNLRMFWDDVTRAFYLDNPSRLTPLPLADTSGLPR